MELKSTTLFKNTLKFWIENYFNLTQILIALLSKSSSAEQLKLNTDLKTIIP